MGGSASRNISVKNDQPIVQVSKEVMDRLRQSQSSGNTAAYIPPASSAASTYRDQDMPSGESGRFLLKAGDNGPFLETVTAHHVRKEKDEEIRQNDIFWRGKLRDLEEQYVTSAYVSEEAFNKELDKINKLIPPAKEVICLNTSDAVVRCYSRHPNEVLKCSEEVKAFSKCVQEKTRQVITSN